MCKYSISPHRAGKRLRPGTQEAISRSKVGLSTGVLCCSCLGRGAPGLDKYPCINIVSDNHKFVTA